MEPMRVPTFIPPVPAFKTLVDRLNTLRLLPLFFILVIAQGWPGGTRAAGENKSGQHKDQTANMVGPNACAECHKYSASAWKSTHHFKTFRSLPRKKSAQEIARRMKIRRIKSESLCLNCHFTRQIVDDKPRVVAGISCESCHGKGHDYKDIHSSYSGKSKETETKKEKKARWKSAENKGMIRPRNLYKLARNCFGCHIVPQEKLVNTGQHSAGSEFELVAWSQGEVRHNLWHSGGKTNIEASSKRKRLMYIVGLAVELEISLRAVSRATNKKNYALKMARRIDAARIRLDKISKKLPDQQEIQKIVDASYSAALKLKNAPALTKAADTIAQQTQIFINNNDGSSLGKLDKLIPGNKDYKGKPLNKLSSVN